MHKYKTKVFLNKCQLSQMKPRHIDSSRALCGTFNRPGKVVGWTSTVASTVNIVRPTTVASLPHSTYIFCQQRWTMSVMNWRLYSDYYSSHKIICIYMPVRLGCSPLRSVSGAFSSAVCLPTKSHIVLLVRQKAKHIAISEIRGPIYKRL